MAMAMATAMVTAGAALRPVARPRRLRTRGSARPVVVGVGVTGVDYLAVVDGYPAADAKVRAREMQVQGGGNAGNAATCLARLGVGVRLVSRVGGDALGASAVRELVEAGVDVARVDVDAGGSTPFTYVVVDAVGGTRTCIHTPASGSGDLLAADVDVEGALAGGVAAVVCDGRHPKAAEALARAARAAGIRVVVEGEKPRDGLGPLLGEADVVVTNASFPRTWAGRAEGEGLGAAMAGVLAGVPLCGTLVTTLGARGSVRVDVESQWHPALAGGGGSPAWAAVAAAVDEAVAEGEATGTAVFRSLGGSPSSCVYYAPAEPVPTPPGVLDTTGAGDAYIGATVYGMVTGMEPGATMKLASTVAARKCAAVGARPGLPTREDLGLPDLGEIPS